MQIIRRRNLVIYGTTPIKVPSGGRRRLARRARWRSQSSSQRTSSLTHVTLHCVARKKKKTTFNWRVLIRGNVATRQRSVVWGYLSSCRVYFLPAFLSSRCRREENSRRTANLTSRAVSLWRSVPVNKFVNRDSGRQWKVMYPRWSRRQRRPNVGQRESLEPLVRRRCF